MLTSTDQTQIPAPPLKALAARGPLDTVVRKRRASKTRYSLSEREISITVQAKISESPPFRKGGLPSPKKRGQGGFVTMSGAFFTKNKTSILCLS